MAYRAPDCQAHESCANRRDAVDHVSGMTFFGQHRATINNHVQTVKAGCRQLVIRWGLEEISCKLVTDKIVVWQVLVERSNHPIAVRGKISIVIMVNTIGVSKTHEIEPVSAHVLAKSGGLQKTIDSLLICIRGFVREEFGNLTSTWWQSCQIQ